MDDKPLRILLVEDNRYDFQLAQRTLARSELNCKLTWVSRFDEALLHLQKDSFDVVVLDHNLPDATGIEIFRQLLTENIDVPVVFVTGTGNEQTAVEALKMGAEDYLVKDPSGEYLKLLPTVLIKAHANWGNHLARRLAEQTLHDLNRTLEQQVEERTRTLNETRARFASILNLAPDGIVLVNEQQEIVVFNQGAEQIFGYLAHEVIGKPINILIPPNNMQQYQAFLDGQDFWNWLYGKQRREVVARRKNGEEFLAETSIAQLVQDGQTTYAAILHDITERKQAESALNQYAQRLEILHQMDQAILAAQSSQEIAQVALHHVRQLIPCEQASVTVFDWASRVCTFIAVETESHLPIEVGLTCPIQDSPLIEHLKHDKMWMEETITAVSNPTEFQKVLHHNSFQACMVVPLSSQGELLGSLNISLKNHEPLKPEFISIAHEVAAPLSVALKHARLLQTEREQRELAETLRETTKALNSTLDLQQVLQIILEQLSRVVDYNSTALMLLNKNVLEVMAYRSQLENVLGLSVLPYEELMHVNEVLVNQRPVMIPDTAVDPRWQLLPSTQYIRCWMGVPLIVKEHVIGILNLNNKQPYTYTTQDIEVALTFANTAAAAIENARLYQHAREEIVERMHAEQNLEAERALLAHRVAESTAELSAANAELARAGRAKDEFLANMSHELRTPLNAILGKTETMAEELYGPLTERQIKALQTIEDSGRHLLALINDILDVAKIEAGKIELEMSVMSVDSICQACLHLVAEMAHKQQLRINTTIDSEAIAIYADGRRLKQILVNLLSNAIKFTPEGGDIGLDVKAFPDQSLINFSVWDTGVGISEEGLRRLFNGSRGPTPFVQLDSSLSRFYEGTGLGLSLVYRLTELHGGSVSLETAEGVGTRFTVSLPWQPSDSQNKSFTNRSTSVITDPPTILSTKQKLTILVAEDNEHNITALVDYLSFYGYQVIIARNGYEAVEQAKATQPNLILMDIQMPKMDGLEAIQRIRQIPILEKTPIFALTALAMPGDRIRCLEAGANEYFSKPINFKNLVEKIQTFVAK